MDLQGGEPWGVKLERAARPDGRRSNEELRRFEATTRVLRNANGSAEMRVGGTSVLACVHGPRENSRRQSPYHVLVRRGDSQRGQAERYCETVVTNVLQALFTPDEPQRQVLSVILQIKSDDGAVLSVLINAAVVALLDAGIPMLRTLVAVTVAATPAGSHLADPCAAEHAVDCPEICIVLDLHSGQLVHAVPEPLVVTPAAVAEGAATDCVGGGKKDLKLAKSLDFYKCACKCLPVLSDSLRNLRFIPPHIV